MNCNKANKHKRVLKLLIGCQKTSGVDGWIETGGRTLICREASAPKPYTSTTPSTKTWIQKGNFGQSRVILSRSLPFPPHHQGVLL